MRSGAERTIGKHRKGSGARTTERNSQPGTNARTRRRGDDSGNQLRHGFSSVCESARMARSMEERIDKTIDFL
jgi:hypothetical protein